MTKDCLPRANKDAPLEFDGKTLIHPKQIAAANETYGPTQGELDHARRLIEVWRQASAADKESWWSTESLSSISKGARASSLRKAHYRDTGARHTTRIRRGGGGGMLLLEGWIGTSCSTKTSLQNRTWGSSK